MTSANILEVVWTTVNVIGFLFSLFAVGDSLGDLRLVKKQRINGPRGIIARANFRRELLRSVQLLLFTNAGTIALLTPDDYEALAIRLVIVGSLIVAALLITVSTVLDRVARYRILNFENGGH